MKIGIIGGGAWGTALAQVAAEGGETLLWAREPEVVEGVNDHHENRLFLPAIPLDPSIRATGDLADLADCGALLVVTPAQHMRSVLRSLPPLEVPLVLCAKGMEEATMELMHDVAHEAQAAAPLAVLSGPTFAHEVAARQPAAVTLAVKDREVGERLRARIARPWFRPYLSDDVVGAEIGGAVKNVLAIACGVVEGRRLGLNARSALISRGFAEMTRFGLAKGARAETLAGLSGLGDLVLTCSSTSSRNFSLGKGLGEGRSAPELLADRRTIAEGAFTAPVLQRAAKEAGVDMPIVAAVCALLAGEASVDQVVERLLSRPLRSEGV
ncbi:MAG: NAD(P)-dependent glycerol-3-phosphate dehydrogenase [Alphaproteobacteria bacterium]|nr:MAG: NAD(P)-dependent glycerol-3-phosphate dehydrogenase [Alphaproteobacteria bacterium]